MADAWILWIIWCVCLCMYICHVLCGMSVCADIPFCTYTCKELSLSCIMWYVSICHSVLTQIKTTLCVFTHIILTNEATFSFTHASYADY